MTAIVPPTLDDLFDRRLDFPDQTARKRLARLVGVDEAKSRLSKLLGCLINPAGPRAWVSKFHPGADLLLDYLERRPPLVLLAGDVGTGKTELAETVGDAVARQEGIAVTLYPLSLATRGTGKVGEMTALISAATDAVFQAGKRMQGAGNGKAGGGIILLVDEADALAQSRASGSMHHEDRAGVNAFIRGVDRLAEQRLPVAVILSTNRLSAIDPAVQRRAAEIFIFSRPNDVQRLAVLQEPLAQAGFAPKDIARIVKLTGTRSGASVGFTFSDLTQRFLPSLVLDAYPGASLTFERAKELVESMTPTPSFIDGGLQ